jgi:hypothetical protein
MTSNENDHPFDNATRLTGESDHYQGHTSERYANMVGPFGGIIAATMLRATLDHPVRQGDPLALTVNFVAPIADGDFGIDTKLVRTNRSTQHWSIELSQQSQIAATATVVFASRRNTWSSTELRFPLLSEAKEGVRVSSQGFPSWVKSYDIRFIKGGIPPLISIENEETFVSSVSLLWIRDEPRRSIDFLSLTAICDSFFPHAYTFDVINLFLQGPSRLPFTFMSMLWHFPLPAIKKFWVKLVQIDFTITISTRPQKYGRQMEYCWLHPVRLFISRNEFTPVQNGG